MECAECHAAIERRLALEAMNERLSALNAAARLLAEQARALATAAADLEAEISRIATTTTPEPDNATARTADAPAEAARVHVTLGAGFLPEADDLQAAAADRFDFDLSRIAPCVGDQVSCSERLTLIKGIDAATASLLNSVGIDSFKDLTRLTPDDVAELGALLGEVRRIAREGWIEQAALLAAEVDTAHAKAARQGLDATSLPDAPGALWRVVRAPTMWRQADGRQLPAHSSSTPAYNTPAYHKPTADTATRLAAHGRRPMAMRVAPVATAARCIGIAAAIALAVGFPLDETRLMLLATYFNVERACSPAALAVPVVGCAVTDVLGLLR